MSQDRSQISWIKRKADSYLHFENQAQGGPTPATDLHRHAILPEEVIRQAELEWIPRWTAIQPAVPWEEFPPQVERPYRASYVAGGRIGPPLLSYISAPCQWHSWYDIGFPLKNAATVPAA